MPPDVPPVQEQRYNDKTKQSSSIMWLSNTIVFPHVLEWGTLSTGGHGWVACT